VSVRLPPLPLHKEIESRQSNRQPRLKRGPGARQHLLEMTDPRQHRPPGLNQPPGIARAARTQLELRRSALLGLEAGLAHDEHRPRKSCTQGRASPLRRSGARALPGHSQADVMEQPAELTAAKPARVGLAFAPTLLGTAPCAQGMEQCDPLAVHYAPDRGGGQQGRRPQPGGGTEAQAARAGRHGAGNQPRQARLTPRENARLPTPLRATSRPKVTLSLGQRLAWGCLATAFLLSSIRENKALLKSSVVLPCSLGCEGVVPNSLGTLQGCFQGLPKLAPLVSNNSSDKKQAAIAP
jgi:hypothetical protein